MSKITIDISNIETRGDIQDILSSGFEFPEYYGRNLDAFNDCFAEFVIKASKEEEVTEIELVGFDSLPEKFEKYGQHIIEIMEKNIREYDCDKISIVRE